MRVMSENLEGKENPTHYFSCLIYLNMGDLKEINLGFAKVWNFYLMRDEKIPDALVRDQLTKILGTYRSSYPYKQNGKNVYPVVTGVGIIDVGTSSNNELNDLALQKIKDAKLILFISSLAYSNTILQNMNTGHSMVTTDNFHTVNFSILTGHEYMTEHTGFILPSWHGGLSIEENMYIRPRYVSTPTRFTFDKELVNALVWLRENDFSVFRKIMSAIDVFYESYYNSSDVSHNARILLQASAFEILIDPKENRGRKAMKDFIKKHTYYPDEKIVTYKYKRNDKEVETSGTLKEKWADRFFSLRNAIIHGSSPNTAEFSFEDSGQRHIDIALYFFIFCLKVKIEEILGEELFNDDIQWSEWTDDILFQPKRFEGFKYEHYGRRGWERDTKKPDSNSSLN